MVEVQACASAAEIVCGKIIDKSSIFQPVFERDSCS